MSTVDKVKLGENDFSNLIIGIDLGTTNSAVSVKTGKTVPTLLPVDEHGHTTLPSCVEWLGEDNFIVGMEAYEHKGASNVVYSIKRQMGTNNRVTLVHDGESREFTPVEISAKILQKLKEIAQFNFPGIFQCIITVPAYFNQLQIEDTVKASKLAGLHCVQILKEPTSASYIYSNLGYVDDGSVLIYDLGGGTFDITVMSFLRRESVDAKVAKAIKKLYKIDVDSIGDPDSPYLCRVLGTYGDTHLGGDDIDEEIANLIIQKNSLPTPSESSFKYLTAWCEQFKKAGYASQEFQFEGKKVVCNSSMVQSATDKIFQRTMDIIREIPTTQLDTIKTIVLVGGATKSDYLVSLIKEAFPSKEVSRVLDPDATVALGAGSVAGDIASGKPTTYRDVLPLSIGVLDSENEVDICINKNTSMPYTTTRTFYTTQDNQQAVSIDVFQGLSTNPMQDVYLGRLRVTDLPEHKAGELPISISFTLSVQGRLVVSTTINGKVSPIPLVIESIFDVKSEDKHPKDSTSFVPEDDFEEALVDMLTGNDALLSLLMRRRQAISEGDISEQSRIEDQILEVL